ncbi:MAG: DNA sulfur modification protein DndB [Dehalococcoidia bacterium]
MTNTTVDGHEHSLPDAADRTPVVGAFEYVFPAIRGVQAGREFFVSMCPWRLIPRVFLFDEDELVPELRAQRVLNRGRLPEIARYIIDNPESYVFSALTASIDGEVRFEVSEQSAHAERMGLLRVPMTARFVINDGQHRRAAIDLALRERPDLADESIAIVFFLDAGLERSQQMFADLNRYAVRPSTSIGVLYDHRDELAELTRVVVLKSPVFRDLVEMERSTLAKRSRKLFTLSAIYTATKGLLADHPGGLEEREALARAYWEAVADVIPDWHAVRARKLSAGEVRGDFIHSHGIALQALGRAGNALIQSGVTPVMFAERLAPLRQLDWSRSNASTWEGRALIGGRVSKASQNVVLTTNVVLAALQIPLDDEQQQAEHAFQRGRQGA